MVDSMSIARPSCHGRASWRRPGERHCRAPGATGLYSKAAIPVMSWPRIKVWMSWVPARLVVVGDAVGAEDVPGHPGDLARPVGVVALGQ
jgi:hypothetical protein